MAAISPMPRHQLMLPEYELNYCAYFTSDDIFVDHPELLSILLFDHTTRRNIIWATNDYCNLGKGYSFNDEITVKAISEGAIIPGATKSRQQLQQRARNIAEVFTPSWICNKQNNLIDNAWFGCEGTFNTEIDNPDGTHTWTVNTAPIVFPAGSTWRDYINANRLEISCGEAPYLASRYDCVTGDAIPIHRRIGLLDRKLRIVCENTTNSSQWLKAAQAAFKSIYGYEWQGDNLFLARKSLLLTFIDYYFATFRKPPLQRSIQHIAYIISWNIWQMDGLKGVIPNSCSNRHTIVNDIFGQSKNIISPCRGCRDNNIRTHNGTYALIKDWSAKKEKQKIRFIDLIKQ